MRKDGSTFPQELSLTVLDDGRHICIVRDVTEQRERERELERYETLSRESRDVNGVLIPDSTFEYLTPSTAGVLGYDPAEFVSKNAFDYVHPEDRDQVAETYTEMVENPEREPNAHSEHLIKTGVRIHKTISTIVATWEHRGLDPPDQLISVLGGT